MNQALVIVDMQEGFDNPLVNMLVDPLVSFVEQWEGEVYHALFHDEANSRYERELQWTVMQNPANQEQLIQLKSIKGFRYIHNTYSVVTPEIQQRWRRDGVGTIYLCGVYTDISIFHSALHLFEQGYHVKVIHDLCSTPHGEDIHAHILDALRAAIGVHNVVYSQDLLQE